MEVLLMTSSQEGGPRLSKKQIGKDEIISSLKGESLLPEKRRVFVL